MPGQVGQEMEQYRGIKTARECDMPRGGVAPGCQVLQQCGGERIHEPIKTCRSGRSALRWPAKHEAIDQIDRFTATRAGAPLQEGTTLDQRP